MKLTLVALRLFLVLSVVTGVLYPLAVSAIALVAFRQQAAGSPIIDGGKISGSELIGQDFTDPKYFWARPSATTPFPYNAMASSGSNLGPTNPALIGGKDADGKPVSGTVADRIALLRAADPGNNEPIPTDLATASASGLDPHISPQAADYQVNRIARARNLSPDKVRQLLIQVSEGRQLGILGEPTVNVVKANLALDRISKG